MKFLISLPKIKLSVEKDNKDVEVILTISQMTNVLNIL